MAQGLLYFFLLTISLASVQSVPFKSIPINQGKLRLSKEVPRSLETNTNSQNQDQNVTLKGGHNSKFTVEVDLGESYFKANNLPVEAKADMLLLLYTNVTGFCSNCDQFVNFQCIDNACKSDSTKEIQISTPEISISKANPISHEFSLGKGDNWKLNTPALLFSKENLVISSNYIKNTMHTPIYGFIGLGLGGDASKNFKTKDGPIFSIQIDNSTGMGDLIFGDDTSRYNSSRVPASLPCDENWSLETESIKLGNTTKNFASKLVFDLQKDGIRLPHRYLTTEAFWWESFRNQFNLTKIQISYDSIYLYNGKLSALPFLTFNLSNGASLSIPPVAYTKPYNETTYQILIDSLSYDEKSNYTVLGWRILSQHYTIFKQNSTGNTITMYPLYSHVIEEDSSHNEFTMLYIVFMVTLAAAIFASLVNCFKRKERTGRDEVGLELKNHMDVMGGIAPIRFDD